ncbi:MAG: GNAT family N-acetyltransferase [Gammaproteobacteria bacterium]|nr:GNAT family N-acetyltransferase [Gammaproteobacteria bacterium]MCZ6887495.1 GNAT family N-acetyltransferase [Gammaproteobacteria bacterium]
MAINQLSERYPQDVTLSDGRKVQLRLMTADDRDAVLGFARSLPEEDLLFLRVDVTQDAVVDDWIANLASGSSTSLVAYDDEALVGYATVHRNQAPWTRRVGEIRVNIGPDYRGKGLGKNLTGQIFDVARALGLKKVMANMTSDQPGAQAAFRRLGFVPEALLADYVEDRNGTSRDLVIMSYDVDGLTDQMDEPLTV